MASENLTWNTIISQARKGGNFLYMMSQTLRKIDVLLREDAKMIWQCWNPFRNGRITYAIGHPGADAALPPWESPAPVIRSFPTYKAFDLYDSWEKYDKDATKLELSEAPSIVIRNTEGQAMPVPVQTVTQYVLEDCLLSGHGEGLVPGRDGLYSQNGGERGGLAPTPRPQRNQGPGLQNE